MYLVSDCLWTYSIFASAIYPENACNHRSHSHNFLSIGRESTPAERDAKVLGPESTYPHHHAGMQRSWTPGIMQLILYEVCCCCVLLCRKGRLPLPCLLAWLVSPDECAVKKSFWELGLNWVLCRSSYIILFSDRPQLLLCQPTPNKWVSLVIN